MPAQYSMPTRAVIHGFNKIGDNETVDIAVLDRPTQVKHSSFATDAALGGGLGIDLIDGGTGAGTDVIESSSDNLNGEEEVESPDTTYSYMADGDVLRLTFDNYTTPTDAFVEVVCHVYR